MENQVKLYTIPEHTINKVLEFLGNQPYIHSAGLIHEIKQVCKVVAQEEKSKEEDDKVEPIKRKQND